MQICGQSSPVTSTINFASEFAVFIEYGKFRSEITVFIECAKILRLNNSKYHVLDKFPLAY